MPSSVVWSTSFAVLATLTLTCIIILPSEAKKTRPQLPQVHFAVLDSLKSDFTSSAVRVANVFPLLDVRVASPELLSAHRATIWADAIEGEVSQLSPDLSHMAKTLDKTLDMVNRDSLEMANATRQTKVVMAGKALDAVSCGFA
jgi:hypothetical protein